MQFKPALTTAELHDICVRQDVADINRLLWEIRRLRIIALRADQFVSLSGAAGGTAGMIRDSLKHELDAEPCVVEDRKSRADMTRIR
jgi:hypothetical protein